MWHVFVLYCINEYFVLVLDYLFIYIQQACKIYNIAGTFNSEICILLTLSVNSIMLFCKSNSLRPWFKWYLLRYRYVHR